MNRLPGPTAIVLLSVFNGERYLADLIDSIISQIDESGMILVRDDGSRDQSCEIIKCFAEKYPSQIELLSDDQLRLGPSLSFGRLVSFGLEFCARSGVEQPLFFFADQDDVWCNNKILVFADAFSRKASEYGDVPVLLYSDLVVVDAQLNEISSSFWSYQGIVAKKNALHDLLISNVVTGCACAFNRKAAEESIPVPPEAMMHDWWFALVCSRFGRIIPIPERTVLYRQHQHNTLGAMERVKSTSLAQKVRKIMAVDADYFTDVGTQAALFNVRFARRLTWFERSFISFISLVFVSGGLKARLLFAVLFKLRTVR